MPVAILAVAAFHAMLAAKPKSSAPSRPASPPVVAATASMPRIPVVRIEQQGPIPPDFRGDPTNDIPVLESRAGKDLGFWAGLPNSSAKRDWNEFWWRQLSFRRDLALRGWLSFGDPVSVYLERVKDSVLAGQPDLRKRLRVYACPSPYVNAMVMPDGLIIVNVGMLARLADESQLALVLAHEAAHFSLRHAEVSWWENRDSKSEAGSDRWERTRFQHSRERESQADSLGLVYLLASRYSTAAVDSMFGILGAADNSQGVRPWSRTALAGFPDLQLPDSVWMDPSKAATAPAETEDSDSTATHPAIPKRRAAAKRQLGDAPRAGLASVVGVDAFLKTREAARHAVPKGWLEANQPAAALFESWSLLESAPGDSALRAVFDQALVDLALDRGATRRSAARAARVRIWGSYQTLDHFLRGLDSPRMFALGVFAARRNVQSSPSDSLLRSMEAELLEEFSKALPAHLQYLRDTTRIARSLRSQKAALDAVRSVLPELSEKRELELPAPPDTGKRDWKGRAYLAGIDWGDRPFLKPFGGVEPGKRIVRQSLATAFASAGDQLVAADPATWTSDSLEALRREARILDWALERMDSRGTSRFRPRLPALRRDLSKMGVDKVVVVSLDFAPAASSFEGSIVPIRVAWLGSPRRTWFTPELYLMGVVFDAKDGGVCSVARVRIWESGTEDGLKTASRKLAEKLAASK